MLEVGSLFSGIGGIELGLERAGDYKTAWFVEYEEYPAKVLKKHWPEAVVYGDITTIDFNSLPRVDVLTGGFPCQDISNAGKRVGIAGRRSGLWSYFAEAIGILRPRYALIENVSALTRRGLDVVLADLAALGYDAEWHCFSASAVGAPHRRDRIIIIAYDNKSGLRELESLRTSQYLADTSSEGLQGQRLPERIPEAHAERSQSGDRFRGWWAAEPGLGRVAYGVPDKTHRIKALGNAVVPAWAEAIGRAIMQIEKEAGR